jgi:hypothetical protein
MKPEREGDPAARVATQPDPSHQNRPSGVNLLLGGANVALGIVRLMVAAPSRGASPFVVEIE